MVLNLELQASQIPYQGAALTTVPPHSLWSLLLGSQMPKKHISMNIMYINSIVYLLCEKLNSYPHNGP